MNKNYDDMTKEEIVKRILEDIDYKKNLEDGRFTEGVQTRIDEDVRILQELTGDYEEATRHNTLQPEIRRKLLEEVYEAPNIDEHTNHTNRGSTDKINLYTNDYKKILKLLEGD